MVAEKMASIGRQDHGRDIWEAFARRREGSLTRTRRNGSFGGKCSALAKLRGFCLVVIQGLVP